MRKVLFFGDSNTYGCDPDGGHSGRRFPEEVRWTGILKKKLEGKWLVGEDGLNGRCIPEMKYETEALEESLRRNEPLDLFAVMLGTNDYLSRPHPDPDGVGKKLGAMLDRVRGLTEAEILVIAPPQLDFSGDRFYRPFSTTDGRLSESERAAAAQAGAGFLDAASWNLEVSGEDHIHLTAKGHRMFAERMLLYFEQKDNG